jgi:hypothetical protein
MDNSKEILQIQWFKKYLKSKLLALLIFICLSFLPAYLLSGDKRLSVLIFKSLFLGLLFSLIYQQLLLIVFFVKHYKRFHSFEDFYDVIVYFASLLFLMFIFYMLLINDFLIS